MIARGETAQDHANKDLIARGETARDHANKNPIARGETARDHANKNLIARGETARDHDKKSCRYGSLKNLQIKNRDAFTRLEIQKGNRALELQRIQWQCLHRNDAQSCRAMRQA